MSTQVKINQQNLPIPTNNDVWCGCVCDYNMIFLRESRIEKRKYYKSMLSRMFGFNK